MRKLVIAFAVVGLLGLSSCYKQKVCPTYLKKAPVEQNDLKA